MNAITTLPLTFLEPPKPEPGQLFALFEPPSRSLRRVTRTSWKGPLLHPGPIAGNGAVLSLNLAQGCAHRCAFCSARAYPSYPGDDRVILGTDTAEQLQAELSQRPGKPRAVYLSPSTDPFMPLAEVQAETLRVVEVLAEQGIEAWLMTRGFIRPAALEVLAKHRQHVKVTVGLTTVDRGVQRILEPLGAPPRLRLRQIALLRERGISVQVESAPLVPGLTDTRDNLTALLESLARVGVRHVTAGYLFLRSVIRDHLARVLADHGWNEMVLDEFKGGPVLSLPGIAPARYLPRARRQRGYAAFKALAAAVGISVSICSLTNPDFRN